MLTHVEKTNTFVSVRFMVDWAVQVATAMEFLIMQDILHRDLKAENVLVKERVCYCDCSYDYEVRKQKKHMGEKRYPGYLLLCGPNERKTVSRSVQYAVDTLFERGWPWR